MLWAFTVDWGWIQTWVVLCCDAFCNTNTVIHLWLYTVIQPGITTNICPVLISDTSQEFLIQPAPSGRSLHGQFLTNISLADTQFNGTQVVLVCAGVVGELCDQLVLRVNSGSEVTPGSFRVRYVPARGGQNIEVDVLYGRLLYITSRESAATVRLWRCMCNFTWGSSSTVVTSSCATEEKVTG